MCIKIKDQIIWMLKNECYAVCTIKFHRPKQGAKKILESENAKKIKIRYFGR